MDAETLRAVPAELRPASPWGRALAAVLALLALIAVLYRDSGIGMVNIWWRSETFAHAFLVLPITLWLVWRQQPRLAALTPRPQPWVLVPLAAVALVWLVSTLVIVDAAAQFAFVTLLLLAVPAMLGFEVTAVILFPLLFLYFAVPFGEFVLPLMMQGTADFVVHALRLSGVPVFREGQQFVIPTGNWSVIDECSGIRYLMASFMVGTLFAYLNYRSYRRRAIFMLIALLVPILANWARAYLIVMMAYLSGNRIATGVDHVIYGWVFFGIIITTMFAIGTWWSEPEASGEGPGDSEAVRAAPPIGRDRLSRGLLMTLLAGAVVLTLPHLVLRGLQAAGEAAAPPRLALPSTLGAGWTGAGAPVSTWSPKFGNPSLEATRAYAGPQGAVGVYLAYYRAQNAERKLVSSQNVLVAMRDFDWNLMPGGTRVIGVGDRSVSVRTAQILGQPRTGGGAREHLVVWRLYWIDGRFVAGDVAAKVAGAWAQLRGHGDDGASIVLYAEGESVAASEARLQAFVESRLDTLDALLRRTHDAR